MSEALSTLLERALAARAPLREAWAADPLGPTDAWRLFHGAVEGRPGLTVDRYGPLVLVQTFREALEPGELGNIEALVERELTGVEVLCWNHRGAEPAETPDPGPLAEQPLLCREQGLRFLVQPRHKGQDPWLFLDFRAGRRAVRQRVAELGAAPSVLNLFSYTCTAGVAAVAGGAGEAWNVDHAESALDVGKDNFSIHRSSQDGEQRPDKKAFQLVKADVIPTLRQLAGLKVRGRAARRRYPRFEPRRFDLVILDPPTFSKGPFGAVDLVRDYPSLFKPALLATRSGGALLATNHVSTVDLDDWLDVLRRCAEKAGRPLQDVEVIVPDPDFPSPDGRHPLKLAWCRV